jgi:hypothetical protein
MKKLILFFSLCMGIVLTVSAQESPLKAYVGKYTFAPGSPVAEVTISIEDTTLVVNSAMGTTVIEKKATDTFYLSQYDANVVFKRGADNAVVEVAILVQGMELVGKKEPATGGTKEEELRMMILDEKLFN